MWPIDAGTLTDGDGRFTIPDVPGSSNAVLVFSYVGFQTQEIKVGNTKNLTVKLQEDNMALDEVVVVGYGTSRKKDLAGSIYGSRAANGVVLVTTKGGRLETPARVTVDAYQTESFTP